MSKVAVIGNTARAIGAVCAADLTLSGHQVRYTVFPEQKDQLPDNALDLEGVRRLARQSLRQPPRIRAARTFSA